MSVALVGPNEMDSPWACDGMSNSTGAFDRGRTSPLGPSTWRRSCTGARRDACRRRRMLAPVAPGMTTVPILVRVLTALMLGLERRRVDGSAGGLGDDEDAVGAGLHEQALRVVGAVGVLEAVVTTRWREPVTLASTYRPRPRDADDGDLLPHGAVVADVADVRGSGRRGRPPDGDVLPVGAPHVSGLGVVNVARVRPVASRAKNCSTGRRCGSSRRRRRERHRSTR